MSELPDWSRVGGVPLISGRLRTEPEDFQVEELALFGPDGTGNHLWLEIEKRGANTDWVARKLAGSAGVPGRDVGYAGMKDRRAVTRQWFSVGLQEAGNSDWESWDLPDARVLRAEKHGRKLKRGQLRGNRFRIVVRSLEGDAGWLEERLQQAARDGVPNYFGPQRFGHGGRNVERGIHWLEQGGRLPRNKRSIYLSAVRSFLFNEVLSRRIDDGSWNRLLEGEIACLDGSRSSFACELPDPGLDRRSEEFDIHPSGPLAGRGSREQPCPVVEQEVLAAQASLVCGLARAGLDSGRRSLRLVPAALTWDVSGNDLLLEFELPPGGYATSVLRELVSCDEGTISKTE